MIKEITTETLANAIKGNLYSDKDLFIETEKAVYKIEIAQDTIDVNPLTEFYNLGTMLCHSHRNYSIGDEQTSDMLESILSLAQEYSNKNFYDKNDDIKEDLVYSEFEKYYISLPLYLYDHSGITINTSGFSCSWDSGEIGIIYISKEKIRKEYSCKNVTKKMRSRIIEYLQSEVKIYDNYLTGEIYRYNIDCFEKKDNSELTIEFDEIEEDEFNSIDSCGGFFGYNNLKSVMIEYIVNAIEYNENELVKQLSFDFNGENEK